MMYYNKEQLRKIREKGEEQLKELEKENKGDKYRSAADMEIVCQHCQHDHFEKGEALLNTRGLTFFDLDWLNGSAITLACTRCGFIHWFAREVQRVED